MTYHSDQVGTALITSGLPEDPDGPDDAFWWDPAEIPEGTYTIAGTITDGLSTSTSAAPGVVIVDRTAPTVTAAPAGGAYAGPQNVTLSAGEPATIFFTIDGSDPTASSPQYAVPISVSTSLTLKFMAIDGAGNRSPVVSASYVIQDASWKAIYGSGSNRPLNATDRAYFELYFFNPVHPWGLIFYSYHGRAGSAQGNRKPAVDFVGTEVTGIAVRGNTAVISGRGSTLYDRRCTFTASVTDGAPDAFGMTIRDQQGNLIFSANPTPLSGGRLDLLR